MILFIGARQPGLTKNTMTAMFARLGRSETVHGFPLSHSAIGRTPRPRIAITPLKISLAHTVGDEVERAYRRTDMFAKRRTLMEQWSKFVTQSAIPDCVTMSRRLRAVPS